MDISVNMLAVVVAAIAAFVVGFLWHGPVFGAQWMKMMGITKADMEAAKKQPMGGKMVGAFAQQLVIAFVLAQFASVWGAVDVMGALTLTFWIWLGFMAAILFDGVLWEKRTMNLYLFNIAYRFVSLAVMAVILVMWK